ncbi:MAG: acetyl-CoA decarbonylase/synthase complex subunit delta [Dehalococcoidales bacterium]|nr:acetyl-CoA decarbonylase/synthase complex subunit delta [Dehalococcoidales bacterium]
MAIEIPETTYNGKVKEIKIGNESRSITVGGESCYPFYLFEGQMPHKPRIAMEVWDMDPTDWAPAALEPFKGVTGDPVAWAQKCIEDYQAEMICLQLVGSDPNGLNRSAEETAVIVRRVAEAINVPLIVWGTANIEKDTEVLRAVAEACQGQKLIMGPLEEKNYKKIGAAALAYQHTIIASSPIDINLAKQLNILIGNLGIAESSMLMDPTVSSIGYGIEYCYSVMERIRMAGLTQSDDKLQLPLVCNISKETWKTKEVKISEQEDPKMGDPAKRGILLEAMSAMCLALAGADILVMRHPEAIRLVKDMIDELMGTDK